MPCYAFDGELKKHDLNPLIKISGAYLVDDSDPDTSLFINVCRDIGGLGVVVVREVLEDFSVFALPPLFLVGCPCHGVNPLRRQEDVLCA